MNERLAGLLHAAIAAVCPIEGVAIADPADKASWRIDFAEDATDRQKAAAAAALSAFDPAAPAPRDSFLARELLALLSADDMAAINAAIAGSPALALLWVSLLAQGEAPVLLASARFQAGWTGLTKALGQARADALMAALKPATPSQT
jgi:hypothetical protein